MRFGAIATVLLVAACAAEKPAYDYPSSARTSFAAACPTGIAECDCTWEKITKAMPVEDYEAAMQTYLRHGTMDRRLTMAKAACSR